MSESENKTVIGPQAFVSAQSSHVEIRIGDITFGASLPPSPDAERVRNTADKLAAAWNEQMVKMRSDHLGEAPNEICGHIGGDVSGAITTVCQQQAQHLGKHGGMGCEWDSSATPGRIPGDRGQRFEVHVSPPITADEKTRVGWHETLTGAARLADRLVEHPVAADAWVVDRANLYLRVYVVQKTR